MPHVLTILMLYLTFSKAYVYEVSLAVGRKVYLKINLCNFIPLLLFERVLQVVDQGSCVSF